MKTKKSKTIKKISLKKVTVAKLDQIKGGRPLDLPSIKCPASFGVC